MWQNLASTQRRDEAASMLIESATHAHQTLPFSEAERRVIRKTAWRLMPFITLCYLVAYLDRSNLGVAALTMMSSLGMNAAQFGIAAGIYFWGYQLGEVPSNMAMVRFGARLWICRIMVTWGIVAMATALTVGFKSLLVLRFVLGVAEAGFIPGIIYYLALWFPAAYRARIFVSFLAAIPVAMILGSPISAALLYLKGVAGLEGWQWLFLIEGLPAILLGITCLFYLPDQPADATWLSAEEKRMLIAIVERDRRNAGGDAHEAGRASILAALRKPKLLAMIVVSFALASGSYGIVFFLPQIIAESGTSLLKNGFMSTLPFVFALVAMVAWGWHSDHANERRWHLALPLIMAAAAFAAAGLIDDPAWKLGMIVVAAVGTYSAMAPFWQGVPLLAGRGQVGAVVVALVSMIGSMSGFFSPAVMGYMKHSQGSYLGGFVWIAFFVGLGAVMSLTSLFKRDEGHVHVR